MEINKRGYLYVLANSSMPDLVKVGKTTKTPSQRTQELSGVTGIPTPFIVVYEQLFEDCDIAEEYIHSMLKNKGYRETDNREFFRAPANEIIHIISKMPGQINNSTNMSNEKPGEDNLITSNIPDELDALTLEGSPEAYPWSDLWEKALNCFSGLDDSIQDDGETLKLFREAAKLGCLMAYDNIGEMHQHGLGVPQSDTKALEYYKEGARKGNYFCYLAMGHLFQKDNHLENYKKCMKLFFENRNAKINPVIERHCHFPTACAGHIVTSLIRETVPLPETAKEMASIKSNILEQLNQMLDSEKEDGDANDLVETYQNALAWAKQNL